jgi:hypothetical protein
MTMWRRNRISPDTTKGRLLWINNCFRWYFIIVGVEQILVVHFPDVTKRKVGECWMDVRYRISRGVVSGSAALASLPSDSKSLRSESDIFATSARGSCGVDPGPVPLRIVTLWASSMGDWLYGVRKTSAFTVFDVLQFCNAALYSFGSARRRHRSNFDSDAP